MVWETKNSPTNSSFLRIEMLGQYHCKEKKWCWLSLKDKIQSSLFECPLTSITLFVCSRCFTTFPRVLLISMSRMKKRPRPWEVMSLLQAVVCCTAKETELNLHGQTEHSGQITFRCTVYSVFRKYVVVINHKLLFLKYKNKQTHSKVLKCKSVIM